MLPQTLATIDEKFLKQVCEDQWPESQTLEFKAVLPNKDEESSQEFRKDVCALANADGGDLVFGISEKDGKANSIVPIASVQVDATKRRLLQILESNVEPRIQGMQTHDCSLASGGFVLVLRIPNSYAGPHRCGPKSAHRFPLRNGTSTSDMTYGNLQHAFGREREMLEKAAAFRTHRVELISSGQTPRRLATGATMAVHIVPLSGLAGRANVNVADIAKRNQALAIGSDEYGSRRYTNLDGVVMHEGTDPDGEDFYTQIFRDGCFEIVKNVVHDSRPGKEPPWVIGKWVGQWLQDGLKAYCAEAPNMEIRGPVVVFLTLIGTMGTQISLTEFTAARNIITESVLKIPEVVVPDIAELANLAGTVQPIMDVLYQCYGQIKCTYFDGNGQWTPN